MAPPLPLQGIVPLSAARLLERAADPEAGLHIRFGTPSGRSADLARGLRSRWKPRLRKWGARLFGQRRVPFVWRGAARFQQGYHVATLEFVRGLRRIGVPVSFVELPLDEVPGLSRLPRLEGVEDEGGFVRGRAEVVFSTAEAFVRNRGDCRIGFTMIETDRFSPAWVRTASGMDEVWVPSEFNRTGFLESGLSRPCHVVPLGVDPEIYRPDGESHPPEGVFVFVSVFGWCDRKAPEILLGAFQKAFSKEDPAMLLCKVNQIDARRDVEAQIRQAGLRPDRGRVRFLWNANLSSAELAALYRSAGAFVSASRGEGWGMPLLEAMACGLPAIAPAWGGSTEFFGEANGFPVRIRRLVEARERDPNVDRHYRGLRWADPDEDQMAARMREVFENARAARERGLAASREVRTRWTWESAARTIRARLKQWGHDL